LVVGYGNSLRGDDGAGIEAVLRVAQECPWVDTRTCHQLEPELAETIALYETVVFVDASAVASEPFIETLSPVETLRESTMHAFTAEALVGLANELYETAWKSVLMLHLPAASIEFGERKSEETERFIEQGVELLKQALSDPARVLQS